MATQIKSIQKRVTSIVKNLKFEWCDECLRVKERVYIWEERRIRMSSSKPERAVFEAEGTDFTQCNLRWV